MRPLEKSGYPSGLDSEDIPAIIRAFESPTSPLRLPGLVRWNSTMSSTSFSARLGRQDEAFVLGLLAVADPRFFPSRTFNDTKWRSVFIRSHSAFEGAI